MRLNFFTLRFAVALAMLLTAVVNVASVSCQAGMGHNAVESIFHSWTDQPVHEHHAQHDHRGDRCCEVDHESVHFAAHQSCESTACFDHQHPDNCQDQKLLDDSLRESEKLLVGSKAPVLEPSFVSSRLLTRKIVDELGSWQQRGPPVPQQFLVGLSKIRLLI